MKEEEYEFLNLNREIMIRAMYGKLFPISQVKLSEFKLIRDKYYPKTDACTDREMLVSCYEIYIKCPNHNKRYE